MSVNKYFATGRLTRDPERRNFADGNGVTRFSLAIDNRRKNKETGEWENQAIFLDFDAWGKQGELINEHFKKGDFIIVEAKAKVDTWEKDGERRSRVLFNVESFEFGPKQRESAPNESRSRPAKTGRRATAEDFPVQEEPVGYGAGEDETIPF